MAMLIDNMTGDSMMPILKYGLILFAMAMASLFCGAMGGRVAATASCGLAKNLRHDIFQKIQTFSFEDIDKFSASSLVTRMTTDITMIQNAFQMTIRSLIRSPLMLIFSIAMSYSINPSLARIFLIMVPIIAGVLILITVGVYPIFMRIFKKYDALNNSVQENINGIRVVKSFVREDAEIKKFKVASEDVRKDFVWVEKIIALATPIMMICIFLSMILVSFFGSQIIIKTGATELTTGQLSSLITYGVQVLAALMFLAFVMVMILMAIEPIRRIDEVLSNASTLVGKPDGEKTVKDGSIVFENVNFKYSKSAKKNALSDINVEIESGQTIGIIGGTGSSKSSLVQLICRLYDVTDGSVKVGGVDVRDYDLHALRDEVAVVLQKNVLFSGTIKDNIRWGRADATDDDIERVCRLAQADEFIQQFPKKYDTYIEQGGSNVSGGQKQRLCIARALIKKPKVLILDDSTSAVDTKTDALIRRAFAEEIPDTTKIIIAQRVSSVEDADKILVMDGGRIVEQGTHDELVAMGGIYNDVYLSQNKAKEVG